MQHRNASLLPDAVDATLVRRFFAPWVNERGLRYASQGRVTELRVLDEGYRIVAQVSGTAPKPYEVSIWIESDAGKRTTLGMICSCPVGTGCKHAAAVLHAALTANNGVFSTEQEPTRPDPVVERWLDDLRKPHGSNPKHRHEKSVVYTLLFDDKFALTITFGTAHRREDGRFDYPKDAQIENVAFTPARYMSSEDVAAARLLVNLNDVRSAEVRDRLREQALAIILRTGRAFWPATRHPLRPGPNRVGKLVWQLEDDGRQYPWLRIDDLPSPFFLLGGPWYVDLETGEVGRVDVGTAPAVAATILAGPGLRDIDAAAAGGVLAALGAPPPRTSIETRIITDPPLVRLRLEGRLPRRSHSYYRSSKDATVLPIAQVDFQYGIHEVTPKAGPGEFREATPDGLVERRRDRTAEDAATARLTHFGLLRYGGWIGEQIRADNGTFGFPETAREDAWAGFLLGAIPQLRAEGWDVEIDDDFPEQVVLAEDPWDVEVTGAGVASHLFELDVSVEVDGRRVPLVPMILEALRLSPKLLASEGRALVGRLPDGRRLALPAERLRSVVATLVELFDPREGKKERISLARAVSLAGLDGALRLRGSGAERLRSAAAALTMPPAPTVAIPAALRAELRPYQHEGLDWLQRLRAHGFGGILADSMGLGKTLQTLAHLLVEKNAGRLDRPALVIAPTSVLPNWHAEAQRFAPSLRTLVLHGPRRAELYDAIPKADLVVTSYALLTRDEAVLAQQEWHVAILDEAQNIKNPAAKTAQVARTLKARQRLALTGTPIENHLGELWSLFAYVDPDVLGERARFTRTFRTPIEKGDDGERRAALIARIAPFVLRRTKENVARELPAKSEIVRPIELGTAQRDLYETIRAAMHKRVRDEIAKRGLAKSRIVILDALLKLRQVCCDPRLLDHPPARAAGAGAKLGALMEMIPELLEDGRRILLFSQFTSMLALIEDELRRSEIPYALLTGSTNDRATPVRRFQDGEIPLFLISLKAGGTGLNLTAADTVIHYDPWWNPAVERQATDRAHRIGQLQPVFVYKLVCEETIEQRILDLQARKGALADALLDGDAANVPLDDEEIAHLFE